MSEANGSQSQPVKFETPKVAQLWQRYWQDRGGPARNELLVHYLPVVRSIARRVRAKLPPEVQFDDLMQAGCLGLMQAVEVFDPAHGVRFQTFCARRVRGAMLDEIRDADWAPRSARRQAKQLQAVFNRLRQEYGRPPTDCELRTTMKLSPEDFGAFARHSRIAYQMSMDSMVIQFGDGESGHEEAAWLQDHEAPNPARLVDERDMIASLPRHLSQTEQTLLRRYYHEHCSLRDIGFGMGLSAARVCQIHKGIIGKLREELVD